MAYALEKYGSPPSDLRSPFLPNDALLEACYRKEVAYPSPYPTHICPHATLGKEIFIIDSNLIENVGGIYHSLEKTTLISGGIISLYGGSITKGSEVTLKAPVVRIYDDTPDFPIRTTLRERIFTIYVS